jgi:putative membrane protein
MDNAKKHYSSLFFLPSFKKSLMALALVCIGGVSLCSYAVLRSPYSIFLGISLFTITLVADVITSRVILKRDPIFIMRRTVAMSFYGWLLWLALIALGVGFSYFFGALLWVKFSLLGFGALLTLRTIVLTATVDGSILKRLLSALLQPFLCIAAFLFYWVTTSIVTLLQLLPFIILTPIITYTAVIFFLSSIDRLGNKSYSMPAMRLFRAFILNWVTDQNAPLEWHLEKMGENADIEVSMLKFDALKPKAAIIVPLVHPGPFKNIGSSLLPSLLKVEYEKAFGCDACTPLGILGHELDLASQAQNHKIISQIISASRFAADADMASETIKATDGYATASCQIFGDTALLCFSLAPKTTEDLPQELGRHVTQEAQKLGIKYAIIVNAHNCLTEVIDTDEHLEELQRAATICLKKAVALPKNKFKVGSATVYPDEFTLKSGMGTGGITAIVIEVDKQKTAYVVIDGNNMVAGLREEIIESLESLGFSESEVLTTDTHAVSALVTGGRGYHPVGEVMDHQILIHHIKEAAKKAQANLEASRAGYLRLVVPQVRVIGEDRLRTVTTLVDKAMVKAKRIAPLIFGAEGLLLILLLAFL